MIHIVDFIMTNYAYSCNQHKRNGQVESTDLHFCIEYKWGNLLDLKHTLGRIYLMSILYVERLQISLHAAY